jgi:hypothetical protein
MGFLILENGDRVGVILFLCFGLGFVHPGARRRRAVRAD